MQVRIDRKLHERLVAEEVRRRLLLPTLPGDEWSTGKRNLKGVGPIILDAIRNAELKGLDPLSVDRDRYGASQDHARLVAFPEIPRYRDLPHGYLTAFVRAALDLYLPAATDPIAPPEKRPKTVLVTFSADPRALGWLEGEATRRGTTRQEILAEVAKEYTARPPEGEALNRLQFSITGGHRRPLGVVRSSAIVPFDVHRRMEEMAAERRIKGLPYGEITAVYREALGWAIRKRVDELFPSPPPVGPESAPEAAPVSRTTSDFDGKALLQAARERGAAMAAEKKGLGKRAEAKVVPKRRAAQETLPLFPDAAPTPDVTEISVSVSDLEATWEEKEPAEPVKITADNVAVDVGALGDLDDIEEALNPIEAIAPEDVSVDVGALGDLEELDDHGNLVGEGSGSTLASDPQAALENSSPGKPRVRVPAGGRRV